MLSPLLFIFQIAAVGCQTQQTGKFIECLKAVKDNSRRGNFNGTCFRAWAMTLPITCTERPEFAQENILHFCPFKEFPTNYPPKQLPCPTMPPPKLMDCPTMPPQKCPTISPIQPPSTNFQPEKCPEALKCELKKESCGFAWYFHIFYFAVWGFVWFIIKKCAQMNQRRKMRIARLRQQQRRRQQEKKEQEENADQSVPPPRPPAIKDTPLIVNAGRISRHFENNNANAPHECGPECESFSDAEEGSVQIERGDEQINNEDESTLEGQNGEQESIYHSTINLH